MAAARAVRRAQVNTVSPSQEPRHLATTIRNVLPVEGGEGRTERESESESKRGEGRALPRGRENGSCRQLQPRSQRAREPVEPGVAGDRLPERSQGVGMPGGLREVQLEKGGGDRRPFCPRPQ